LQDSINTWIAAHADSSVVKYRITGSSLLFDKNNEVVRRNISYGLGLAFLVVSLIMGILFRNWRMVIIALIPNLVPIFVCAALMGYLGMELSAATSIIFAIAFGIAVDDTIHFLSRFRLELSRGRKVYDAVRNTFLETGKAMCMTTVILFFGFVILVTSSYPNTVVIGLLMSLTLVSALIADLLLTPVLIYWLIKDK
jgi:predicted RND superfamily exporter protein